MIPEQGFDIYIKNLKDFSPTYINISDLSADEVPLKISMPLKEFELSIIQYNYRVLSYGRKYYKLEDSVIFADMALMTESDELIYSAYMFSKTSNNVYNLRYIYKDDKILNYYCNCKECKRNKIYMCYHIVAGLFQLRLLLKNNHIFEYMNEEDEEANEEQYIDNEINRKFEQKVKEIREKYQNSCNEPHVLKEMTCQICLEIFIKPVLMACRAHSICENCVNTYLKNEKNWSEEYQVYRICCPMCGESAGILKIAADQELKINKELERVRNAYIMENEQNERNFIDFKKYEENKKNKYVKKLKSMPKRKIEEVVSDIEMVNKKNKKGRGKGKSSLKLRSQGKADEIVNFDQSKRI